MENSLELPPYLKTDPLRDPAIPLPGTHPEKTRNKAMEMRTVRPLQHYLR